MLRLPNPRPFIKPEPQRPRLTNVLVLAVAAPYAFFFTCFVLGATVAVIYLGVLLLFGGR